MNTKILLVDEDQLLREVIGDFLRSRGYEVDVAENRAEAIESVLKNKYGLALIGHGFGKRNGIRLMRAIQQSDPNVFCLIMTGYYGLKAVSAALEEGSSDYILKPFQLEELINILRKHL